MSAEPTSPTLCERIAIFCFFLVRDDKVSEGDLASCFVEIRERQRVQRASRRAVPIVLCYTGQSKEKYYDLKGVAPHLHVEEKET